MPYTPTWNNPYLPQGAVTLPYQAQYQQPVNGIVKVNGRDSALQYQLPPNSTSPALFDNTGTCFYIVSTDGTGMKTVECFDFQPHVEQTAKPTSADYVGRAEYEQFVAKVSASLEALSGVHAAVPATGTTDTASGTDGTAPVHDAGRPFSGNL